MFWRRQRDSLSPAGSVRVGSACHRQPFTTDPFESFLMPNKKSTTRVLFVWRRQRDSNPRGVSPKRFSRPPRYDRFDMPPSIRLRCGILDRSNIITYRVLFVNIKIKFISTVWYVDSKNETPQYRLALCKGSNPFNHLSGWVDFVNLS